MNEQEEMRVVMEEEARRETPRRRLREQVIFSKPVTGFVEFIRERGVMGLAIGFVLGGAVSKVTSSFSTDILTPALAYFFGGTERLADITVGTIAVGKFLASIVDFLVLALAVYIIFKILKLDRLDKQST